MFDESATCDGAWWKDWQPVTDKREGRALSFSRPKAEAGWIGGRSVVGASGNCRVEGSWDWYGGLWWP